MQWYSIRFDQMLVVVDKYQPSASVSQQVKAGAIAVIVKFNLIPVAVVKFQSNDGTSP